MEDKFFKEIQKKMNVKTIKNFEKELRKILGMSFKLKEKQIPILQENCLLVRLIYGMELRMVVKKKRIIYFGKMIKVKSWKKF